MFCSLQESISTKLAVCGRWHGYNNKKKMYRKKKEANRIVGLYYICTFVRVFVLDKEKCDCLQLSVIKDRNNGWMGLQSVDKEMKLESLMFTLKL